MSDVLAGICAVKREHVARRKAELPLCRLEAELPAEAPRGFARALGAAHATGRPALIAEIKKASPSKGLIRADFDPAALARAYAAGGAACLSVLTDEPYFQGRDQYLADARAAVPLPALRKDFMLDSWQIVESRWLGADAVLLIMACLDDAQARELARAAAGLGMDVLVEVHDEAELDRALVLPGTLLGVNNRDLRTLEVDLATFERLAARVPADRLLVAESGLYGHADLARMARAGARAFLVGESLMRERDVAAATRRLLGLEAAA
jgi:indole-3-glycerol phosphate synthase